MQTDKQRNKKQNKLKKQKDIHDLVFSSHRNFLVKLKGVVTLLCLSTPELNWRLTVTHFFVFLFWEGTPRYSVSPLPRLHLLVFDQNWEMRLFKAKSSQDWNISKYNIITGNSLYWYNSSVFTCCYSQNITSIKFCSLFPFSCCSPREERINCECALVRR